MAEQANTHQRHSRGTNRGEVDFDAWGVTSHLWIKGYMYESSPPLPFQHDTPAYDWAYGFPIKQLLYVLIALDKYKISPHVLSAWFGIWHSRIGFEKIALSDMMTLLFGTYKFDAAIEFFDITGILVRRKENGTNYRWRPLLPRLLRKFPALKGVITPDSRIMRCLNRNNEPYGIYRCVGLCLDCFNASIYPWDGTSKVPGRLAFWAHKNLETLFRKAGPVYGCRIAHDWVILERSLLAGDKSFRESREWEPVIREEAKKRGREIVKHVRVWR